MSRDNDEFYFSPVLRAKIELGLVQNIANIGTAYTAYCSTVWSILHSEVVVDLQYRAYPGCAFPEDIFGQMFK